MPKVVGVQFRPVAKIYYFDPAGLSLEEGDFVVVETSRGKELGQVVLPVHTVPEEQIPEPLKQVVRRANPWDLVSRDQWTHKEQEALDICHEKVQAHGLKMKLVRCEYNFDGGRLIVYFTAEKRVDFRALVRDLAKTFRTRIEMRQIGERDEAKMLTGIGRCGRELCCASWLREFHPVSIKMAKAQSLPLNPSEISGVCGKLLCCLSYELLTYQEANKKLPRAGSTVMTLYGKGKVLRVNALRETVTVRLRSDGEREGDIVEVGLDDLLTKEKPGKSGYHGGDMCGGCALAQGRTPPRSAQEMLERMKQGID